jgi:hypothetical protein
MKPESPSARKTGAGRKNKPLGVGRHLPASMPSSMPMAWMDPMSWRLPSGRALAEFALQSGFLAPLILRGPKVKTPWQADSRRVAAEIVEEAPERIASFRHTQ